MYAQVSVCSGQARLKASQPRQKKFKGKKIDEQVGREKKRRNGNAGSCPGGPTKSGRGRGSRRDEKMPAAAAAQNAA